jgi:hypothetical protein
MTEGIRRYSPPYILAERRQSNRWRCVPDELSGRPCNGESQCNSQAFGIYDDPTVSQKCIRNKLVSNASEATRNAIHASIMEL